MRCRMENFDDGLPMRKLDNFQFVNFTALANRATAQQFSVGKWEASFALSALMEIPDQYEAIVKGGMLGTCPSMPVPPVSVRPAPVLAATYA
jgi:E3 ubiquitin-protein ligase RGLG